MKLFRIFVVMIASLVSNIFLQANVLALEKETHYFLNEKIVVGTNLDNYLKTNLGLANGINEEFNGKKVLEWVKDGGKTEDEPMYTRSFNHFHNPLKTWNSAGFKGTFQSSVIWAQDQGTFGSLWGGNFSWKAVREYYYIALTGKDFTDDPVAPTQTDKEKYFGKTFRGIGQVMHLVQDVSVPAHTRNDTHVIGYHYELAVDKMRTNGDPVFTNAIAKPISFDPAILTSAPNPLAPIPIAKIFDADKYDSANPDPVVTASNAIGLSEYSNANFVSEGLLSANFQDFPFPRINDTSTVGKPYTGTSGNYIRQYYAKNCCGETNAGKGYLLSTVDFLDYWRQKYPLLSAMLPKIPGLDDNVYKDYASLLLPRAVGYSAGLLNYFFRGNIDITLPNSGIYSSTTDTDLGFTTIKIQAKNTSAPGEDMLNGSIELVVKYKRALEDPFKNYPEDYDFQVEPEFSYIVVPEKNGVRTIPRTDPIELTFDLSTPMPLWAIDVYLQVVYHGKLGNEDGAVAVGFKDISEPTPIDMSSDTDKICISGSLYIAGSQTAIDLLDKGPNGNNNGKADEWDVYQHSQKDIYIKIAPQNTQDYVSLTDYTFFIPALAAGGFSRDFYILTDEHFNYSIIETWGNDNQSDPWTLQPSQARLYTGTAIKNQTDYVEDAAECAPWTAPCDIWWYPTFLSYRNRDEWWGTGKMYFNNAYPQGSECFCYQGILNTCMQ